MYVLLWCLYQLQYMRNRIEISEQYVCVQYYTSQLCKQLCTVLHQFGMYCMQFTLLAGGSHWHLHCFMPG